MATFPESTSTVPDVQNLVGKHRELTQNELHKLAKDTNLISPFKRDKFEKEAKKNWDLFYKRNTTKFFKDRHWTTREFQELCGTSESDQLTVLEVGCGVGNFIFPLIQELPHIYFHACDLSPRAVQFVKDHPLCTEGRCNVFQCDLTSDNLSDQVPGCSVDIVTMIFVLSAIHPEKMSRALKNIHAVLKPGGCVLLRDYGLYDHAMLRFAPGHKLGENFYVRQDGTRAYYFSTEVLGEMFRSAGFEAEVNDYIYRQTVNRKEGLNVERIFVQAKFVKMDEPASTDIETKEVVELATDIEAGSEISDCATGISNVGDEMSSAGENNLSCTNCDNDGAKFSRTVNELCDDNLKELSLVETSQSSKNCDTFKHEVS